MLCDDARDLDALLRGAIFLKSNMALHLANRAMEAQQICCHAPKVDLLFATETMPCEDARD